MRRVLVAVICLAAVAACGSDRPPQRATSSSASSAPTLVSIGAGLEGPAGVHATVYASGVTKVAALAFDNHGRLWLATADYSDTGQDGVYVVASAGAPAVKVIADLHTPLGLLWIDDDLLVASKEKVERYTGFDGAAFAGHTTLVAFPVGVGEVNGLTRAPDGRVQVGISAPCDHCTPSLAQSGTIESFAPDGSDVRVDAKAIRAPIALTYFPGTSDLFVTMNQRDDLGDAAPGDWLSVVRAGDSWGFPDCYGQGGSACAGVPSPVATLDPHAAVSGVAILTGALGSAPGPSAIVAEWATGKVLRVALTTDGSTYRGTVSPLLTGLQNPVPVIADGTAVLVGDWTTGTVYRIANA